MKWLQAFTEFRRHILEGDKITSKTRPQEVPAANNELWRGQGVLLLLQVVFAGVLLCNGALFLMLLKAEHPHPSHPWIVIHVVWVWDNFLLHVF